MAASYLNISLSLSLSCARAHNCFHRFRNGVGRLLINGTSRRRDFELRAEEIRECGSTTTTPRRRWPVCFPSNRVEGLIGSEGLGQEFARWSVELQRIQCKIDEGESDKRGVWENRILGESTTTLGWKSPEVIGGARTWETTTWKSLPDSSDESNMIYFRGKIDLLGESFSWICNSLGFVKSFHERAQNSTSCIVNQDRNQYIHTSEITIFIYVCNVSRLKSSKIRQNLNYYNSKIMTLTVNK